MSLSGLVGGLPCDYVIPQNQQNYKPFLKNFQIRHFRAFCWFEKFFILGIDKLIAGMV